MATLQFLSKKYLIFFSAVHFFQLVIKTLDPDESGFGLLFRQKVGSGSNKYGSETLHKGSRKKEKNFFVNF